MSKKKINDTIRRFAQTCDSRKCRSENKDEIIKNFCEAVTTVHEINLTSKIIKCMDCGKITKLK